MYFLERGDGEIRLNAKNIMPGNPHKSAELRRENFLAANYWQMNLNESRKVSAKIIATSPKYCYQHQLLESVVDLRTYQTKLLGNGPARYTPLNTENKSLQPVARSMTTRDMLIEAVTKAVSSGKKEGFLDGNHPTRRTNG